MSSPSSSLRKVKKCPLPKSRSVPFRPAVAPRTSCVDADIPPTHRHIVQEIRHHGSRSHAANNGHAPSDSELLGTMATRLALVERELLAAKREVVEKDQYIRHLEERVAVLEGREEGGGGKGALELKCLALQRQVEEMEEFLNDYGMVWVGSGEERGREEEEEEEEKGTGGGEKLWVPQSSLPSLKVDFDLIIKNVKELNVLAGEGSASVQKTISGAKLKPVEPVPLTLYKNGIVMFQGPFRPFTNPSTMQCVVDLMEGYFPSELQERFPDGVPLKLTDCRDVVFRERQYADIFPGAGRQLGGDQGPSRLLPSTAALRHHEEETSELPGPKLSLDTFLSQLPACVVHSGRVIDIRSGIADTLQGGGGGGGGGVTLVETPVLQEIRSRLDVTEGLRPPTPSHTTTLRVKSEQDEQTYVLKMKYSDTIGDVRKHIDRLRPMEAPTDYQLKSTFPTRTFSDPTATLQNLGLFPTMTLLMTKPGQHRNHTVHQ